MADMFGFKNGKIVESEYTRAEQEAMEFLRECGMKEKL